MSDATSAADTTVMSGDPAVNGIADGPEVIRDVAGQIIRRYSIYGALGGVLPLPGIDAAVIIGVQIKMVADLCEVYGQPFSRQAVKAYIVALLGGALPVSGVAVAIGSAVKSIPGLGSILGILVVPGVAAASTWAVGRVFAWHFEKGGTLSDFDADAERPRFQREFSAARSRAKTEGAAAGV
jgi:uncharacterized protein (DUF697 family)